LRAIARGLVLGALAFAVTGAAASPAPEGPDDAAASWGDRRYGLESRAPSPPAIELLDGFDDASPWSCRIEGEDGFATTRSFASPLGPDAGSSTEATASSRKPGPDRALGIKVEFLRRSASIATIAPPEPLIAGLRCAFLSLRVLGRSYRHELSIVVLDYYGRPFELPLGRLDFSGWKKLTVYVPLEIVQDDAHYERPGGLRIAALRLRFDPEEAYGSFYAYFDRLEATIDGYGPTPSETGPSPRAAEGRGPADSLPEPAGEEAAGARILELISKRISSGLSYPAAARRRGIEGTLVAAFEVDEAGRLAKAGVDRSSGSDILDTAGLELLKSVFPVENDSGRRLSLRIAIGYKLDGQAAP
jgi:TonB family protein